MPAAFIGPLEVVILLIVLLLLFGSRKLPELGRTAGENLRKAGKGARQLGDSTSEKIGDRVDPKSIGRSAGKGVREARDLRDSFTGAKDAASGSSKDQGTDGKARAGERPRSDEAGPERPATDPKP